ncbi:MAG: phosphatidylethanolamine-binding protein [Armatimonadetes bacterium RBG_16_58_9]|nr:MAG: phosphatidylethanolamine-binding protein [Armatimonadetes bacterium RBG_16_58_9]
MVSATNRRRRERRLRRLSRREAVKMNRVGALLGAIALVLCSCRSENTAISQPKGEYKKMQIKVTSSAFSEGQMIPPKYTCDGANVSPPLAWDGIPTNALTIALISDDPDAPAKTWVHWVLYNLPANVKELPENVKPEKKLANGALQGTNDSGKIGYSGPCPPSGTHRYYFKIYALDKRLDLQPGATKPQLLEAMTSHILAEGQLMGKYRRR